MPLTTMKMDTSLRDRIAALARRHQRTNVDELVALVARAEQEDFWSSRAQDMAKLSQQARGELAAHQRMAQQYALANQERHAAG